MVKKICFIGAGLEGGGQERALTNFANTYASIGADVTIICLFKTNIFFKIHPNIKIVWPTINRETNNKFIYSLKLIPYIRKNIKLTKPDVIISFGDWFNAYSIFATRFLYIRTVITNRMGPNLHLGKFLEFANTCLYRFSDAMIVQTDRARIIMQKKYKLKNIHVVPNIINPININGLKYEKNIISIGRLSKDKGHKYLIEAFSKLNNQDWKLHIVGDGPEMLNLKILVDKLNLKKNVIFHGHLKDFSSILQKTSIFVLPSLYEGFPNALLEAMSIPLACISSDCVAGPREIIQNGVNGLLFEPQNVNDLFCKLDYLVSNKEQQINLRNEALKVRQEYSSEKIFALLNNII